MAEPQNLGERWGAALFRWDVADPQNKSLPTSYLAEFGRCRSNYMGSM